MDTTPFCWRLSRNAVNQELPENGFKRLCKRRQQAMNNTASKRDHQVISEWVTSGASVLDLGCGDGELLSLLIRKKQVRAQGIELSEQAIQRCVAAGLSVFQEDIDTGLSEYADASFDYVILNQTFQQVKKPDFVLKEALRVGKQVIVGFPNF